MAAEGITGKILSGKRIEGCDIYFRPDLEVDPEDSFSLYTAGIISDNSGRHKTLTVYGADELILSTSLGVSDPILETKGEITADRNLECRRGLRLGQTTLNGYGWADWYSDMSFIGSIYASNGRYNSGYKGFYIEGRNENPVVLKATDSYIELVDETKIHSNLITNGGIANGKGNKDAYGWEDFYYFGAHCGAIFGATYAIAIEARNGNDIVINSDQGSGIIRYYGKLIHNSSERYKDNIAVISEESADKILGLLPKEYTYKATGKHGFGLIAEHTQNIFPQIVISDSQGRPDGISYIELIPISIKKIQIQEAEINQLKEAINNIKSMIQGDKTNE